MRYLLNYGWLLVLLGLPVLCLVAFRTEEPPALQPPFHFPWRQAGLTERQAAAHLLSRFTYGAMPGQVEEVVQEGLEKWFAEQLQAGLPDDTLNSRLAAYDALTWSNAQMIQRYPGGGQLLRRAIQDGVIEKDSINGTNRKTYHLQLAAYMQQHNLRPQQELIRQFVNQKILRAAYTHNQLQEVLTEFWFNHFNVSFTKNDCAAFIPNYERDVIRPHALGRFQDLLLATAKSPAMLLYLDNFSSTGTPYSNTLLPMQRQAERKAQGLNENYAREVMELHTLGVDGGYTQQDVTQAARVLTGWTLFPMSDYGNGALKKIIQQAGPEQLAQRGFVQEGDFLFVPNRHDRQPKTVLGQSFGANGGYEEGVQLLQLLAHHPSTAKFIAAKIAVRFVGDHPLPELVNRMAKTFAEKDGDIRQVLLTMVCSPAFWSREALREKTKSPFELAISAVRGLDAAVGLPYQLYGWISKMGQKMYYYQAPTGFPDKGEYWINTGALLNRMNFGLALASRRIPGIVFNPIALNQYHEPESAADALLIYGRLLMPERNLQPTVQRLMPLLNDPGLQQKVDAAAAGHPLLPSLIAAAESGRDDTGAKGDDGTTKLLPAAHRDTAWLPQVIGILIGSPEFQRR